MKVGKNTKKKIRVLTEKIRMLRVSQNLTQKELADSLQKSPQSISGYENGNVVPSLTCLMDYAENFQVSLLELLDIPGEKTHHTGMITPTNIEMQMIEAYRRRPEWLRKTIRSLCFNGISYRTAEEEVKELETILKQK